MDIIEDFYNKVCYPNIQRYKDNFNLNNLYDKILPPDPNLVGKSICIAGCGTLQPFLIAKNHKQSSIMAVDVSAASIKLAKELCDQYELTNVEFVVSTFEKINQKFDVIISTGVLHHVEDVNEFLNKTYENLIPGGVFKGFVYYIRGRKDIAKLNKYFLENNFSLHDVKEYFKTHQNNFFETQSKEDEEIMDVWLNPRFVEYDMETFYDELLNSSWKTSKFLLSVVNNKKLYFELSK